MLHEPPTPADTTAARPHKSTNAPTANVLGSLDTTGRRLSARHLAAEALLSLEELNEEDFVRRLAGGAPDQAVLQLRSVPVMPLQR